MTNAYEIAKSAIEQIDNPYEFASLQAIIAEQLQAVAGRPHGPALFPADVQEPKDRGFMLGPVAFRYPVTWQLSDEEASALWAGTHRIWQQLVEQAKEYAITYAREHGPGGEYRGYPYNPYARHIVSSLRKFILRRDGMRCRYCGTAVDRKLLQFDHVVPFSRGGLTTHTNLVVACHPCNTRKRDRLLEECGMQLIPLQEGRP